MRSVIQTHTSKSSIVYCTIRSLLHLYECVFFGRRFFRSNIYDVVEITTFRIRISSSFHRVERRLLNVKRIPRLFPWKYTNSIKESYVFNF